MTLHRTTLALCAIVPVFDHEHAVGAVIREIIAAGLPCIVVDDGSGEACARVLDELVACLPGVTLQRRALNGGKGAAVSVGLRAAMEAGYTHALQIDADGQHETADIPKFISAAARHPDSIICGRPRFDATIPRSRYYLRYLTHIFVWINTLSLTIHDSMCGFRIYPVEPMIVLLDSERIGSRMDFDIEVLVRLHWRGVPMRWIWTRVRYPTDGISHFRLLLDNALITRLHTRLFFGMLWRLPTILARRLAAASRATHA